MTLFIEPELKEKINIQSHVERITMSELIRRVIASYIQEVNNAKD
jgi:hypothetical protein